MIYDLVIIGMGPAGVSAAIYAKRAGLNILCLDKSMIGGYVNYIDKIDNYPGLNGISGPDLAMNFFEHLNKLDIEFKNKKVISIIDGDIKKIITENEEYLSKFIIIATGRKARYLGLENEKELIGRGISHCALCDGNFYKDKIVAVVGGGNSALQEALHLSNICKKVYLIYRGEEFKVKGQIIDKINEKNNINKLMGINVSELKVENSKLNGLKFDNGKELDVDGLFVYIGFEPGTEFAATLGVTDKDGYILVNNKYETVINGIYAVGDIIKKDYYQISTAVADGAIAAINIVEKCK